jgi:hypothetical protein
VFICFGCVVLCWLGLWLVCVSCVRKDMLTVITLQNTRRRNVAVTIFRVSLPETCFMDPEAHGCYIRHLLLAS